MAGSSMSGIVMFKSADAYSQKILSFSVAGFHVVLKKYKAAPVQELDTFMTKLVFLFF